MHRTIIMAAVLLAIQIGLAVALYFGGSEKETVTPDGPLLGVKAEAITGLEISGPEKDRIVVQKSDGGWILPESFGASANGEQVTALLTRLADLKQGLAVATSPAAAKRFKVAEDLFERHVVVKEGDQVVGDFFAGTSPGFRRIHARRADRQEIVAVALSTFELPTATDQWLDKNVLRIKEDEIAEMSFADFTLRKVDKIWQLDGLAEGRETDAKAARDLVDKVTGLTVQAVLKAEEVAPLFSGLPALHYTVTKKDGGTTTFTFAKAEGDSYVVKKGGDDHYYKIHTLQVEGLLKATGESLVKNAEVEAEKKSDSGTGEMK